MNARSSPPPSEDGNGDAPRDRVAGALRARIRSDVLHPGDRLPSQDNLAVEFGVHRSVVRQALDLLEIEGLIVRPGRQGARAQVAGEHEGEHGPYPYRRPRRTGVELIERVTEAFRAEHVTIDAISLTTETLNQALANTVLTIGERRTAPESVSTRLLVPSPQSALALPRHLTDPSDTRPLERLNALMRSYALTLKNTLETLVTRGLVDEVSVQIRTVSVTPTFKLYLLNGQEALFGYYRVVERSVEYKQQELEIYDVLGMDSKLFRHSAADGEHEEHQAAFVEESQQWFDSMWETIATPLDLA